VYGGACLALNELFPADAVATRLTLRAAARTKTPAMPIAMRVRRFLDTVSPSPLLN